MHKSYIIALLLAIALFLTTYKLAETKHELKEVARSETTKKEAILSVIHSRKSVRVYQDKPVSKEDLLTILKAGMAAPSGIDKRPWRFVAVTNSETLAKLNQKSAPAAIVVCADMNAVDKRAPEFWVTDTSVATENMLLAIEGMGLGGVWKSVYPWKEYTAQVKTTLNLPENLTPLCMITLGHPTGVEVAKDKFEASNIHWEKW